MRTHLNQAGVGHIAAVFVIVFLGVAGFAGYKVVTMNKAASTTSTVTFSPKVPKTITSKADLAQAGKALDSTSAQVDSSLNDNSLNADLNDLL
jgi:hypothetical protein